MTFMEGSPVPAKRKLNLDDFRQRLEAERERLAAQLEALEERTQRKHDGEERGQEMALEENIEDLLQRVEAAFEKIDRGTYGVCDACGRSIKMARLKALPYATLCVECQGRMERA